MSTNNIHIHTFSEAFTTEKGATLEAPYLAYKTWGTLNASKDNAVVIFHALTGNAHADEWFEGLFKGQHLIDLDKHFVICCNVPGSCYGSVGPSSINPASGRIYGMDFPELSIRDMVRLQIQLFDFLGIRSFEFAIGGSMGGMQALEFCLLDSRAQKAALFAMGAKHSAWAIGWNHAQRSAIATDENWKNGGYSQDAPPIKGLASARQMAMISYRSQSDYSVKFDRNRQEDDDSYQVESYLNYQGEKMVKRFDARAYWYLTLALDSHDIGRDRNGIQEALKQINIPVLVVGIDTDILYPTSEQKEIADGLSNGLYREIKSAHGHDAFLIEFEQMNRILSDFKKHCQKDQCSAA